MPKDKVVHKNRFPTITHKTRIPPMNSDINQLNPKAQAFSGLPLLQTMTPPTNDSIIQQMLGTAKLQILMSNIVKQTITNITEPQLIDEQITYNSNLDDLNIILDMVNAVRDFSGDISDYTAWRKSVDTTFELYGHLMGTAKYFGIISVIRNKITGQANIALESYNTPLNWIAIKQCLNTHYADRRDIGTLEYQLTTLMQGNDTVDIFYQKVYRHLSMMLNN